MTTKIDRALYDRCIANGCTPRLAEVLAGRKFPGIAGTDSVFMEGRKLDGSQFEAAPAGVGAEYVRRARAAGVNPAGKYYAGGLARFPGDPRAWVAGSGDVRRVCESEGWACAGAVKVETPRYAETWTPPDVYRAAPDIVEKELADRVAEDPSLGSKVRDLRSELTELRSGVA